MMNKDIFVKLLQERRYKSVKDVLDVMNAVDIASLLGEFDDKELALAFRLIPKEKAADVFANMESSLQSVLVEVLSEKELKEILDDLYMDDTVDLLEELPANLVTRILDASGPKERETINKLLNYPEDSAGSIMTTEYVDLKPHLTVGQALAHIKETGIHKETIYTCYVIQQRKLLGIVSAKDLLTTDDDVLIEDIMETEIISVSTLTDKEEVAHQLRKYDLLALPVLDNDGLLVGIVTFDDAMDVMVEEATEDITKMAAVAPSEKTYFEVSAWEHAKRRIPWLLVLMFSSIITGSIITRYENAFAAIPLLVSFIPMLMDTGGNCGSQSSTLIIRGIALNQVTFHDFFRVIWKEFRVSLIVGRQRTADLSDLSTGRYGNRHRPVPGRNRYFRQTARLHPPDVRQKNRSGPGTDGISADHYHRRCEFHYDLLLYRNESISPVGIKNITKSITVAITFFLHFSKILVFIWIYSYNIITYDIFSYCRQRPAVSVSTTCRKELQV